MIDLLREPWPWWVAGPLLGATVPILAWIGGKRFGISSSLRHMCAATPLARVSDFFAYDWRSRGAWSLLFVLGIVVGGAIAATLLATPDGMVAISEATRSDLAALGVQHGPGLAPDLFSWSALTSKAGFLLLIVGGFLVGFGTRYADGCTSGHALSGLSTLEKPSLIAVVGFFGGGLLATHLLLPWVLR